MQLTRPLQLNASRSADDNSAAAFMCRIAFRHAGREQFHGVGAPYPVRGRISSVNVTEPNDTDARIEAVLVAGYRAMSASQKLARVITALTRAVQELALLDIRRRHPEADQRDLALRLRRVGLTPTL